MRSTPHPSGASEPRRAPSAASGGPYVVIAIVVQNATVRRSVQTLQALFERYGTLVRFDPGSGMLDA
jgi:hypothetical protein